MLTAREVAERFGVTVETILRLTRRDELPALRSRDGELRYPLRYAVGELEAWLVERTGAAPREGESQLDDRAHGRGYVRLRSLTRANAPRDAAPTEEVH
jgi:excisionase family DNA binding protein